MTTDRQRIGDRMDQVAVLVAQVGACYETARRYRRLAGVCEERYLNPALDIASTLRGIIRSEEPHRPHVEGQIARLRRLLTDCDAAIQEVRNAEPYRRAQTAWHEGNVAELWLALPDVFASVVPERPTVPLHYPVALRGRKAEPGEHFIAAIACADKIALLARDGIPAESLGAGLGTDDQIRAVPLTEDPSLSESPVVLQIDPSALRDVVVCRVGLAGDLLAYTPRLSARFEVQCAHEVDDEWWSTRPGAYRAYVRELQDALGARGIGCRTAV